MFEQFLLGDTRPLSQKLQEEGIDLEQVYCRLFREDGRNASAPDPTVSRLNYEAGIERAIRELRILDFRGGVRYAGDHWSHFSTRQSAVILDAYNTRPLDPDVRPVLQELSEAVSHFHILELGLGAGLAASTLSRRYPTARIDAVSLTPVNPYLRFLKDAVTPGELQSEGQLASIFEPVDQPFISLQQLGMFPDQVLLPPAHYHFIYETFGPIAHYKDGNTHVDLHTVARALDGTLAGNGVLFAGMHEAECEPFAAELSKADPSGDLRIVRRKGSFDYVVFARRESSCFGRL